MQARMQYTTYRDPGPSPAVTQVLRMRVKDSQEAPGHEAGHVRQVVDSIETC
jgi:hypothetical protein